MRSLGLSRNSEACTGQGLSAARLRFKGLRFKGRGLKNQSVGFVFAPVRRCSKGGSCLQDLRTMSSEDAVAVASCRT